MKTILSKLVLFALLCILTTIFIGAGAIQAAESVGPITVNINTSPWFKSFSNYVELYEEETGNKVELNVNPYLGSLEATRNSVRADEGFAHLVVVDNNWLTEFYSGGFLTPLNDIDPNFILDPGVNRYDGTLYWDSNRETFNEDSGALMAVPINGNVNVLFYREDLYKKHGLKLPKTWNELLNNAKKLHNPPETYGYVIQDDRKSATYGFFPNMFAWGGSLFKDPGGGDFTITFNSPTNKNALDFYIALGQKVGQPTLGSTGQSDIIQMMVTGKAAHINTVIAAWSQFDNPNKSIVVDKINAALIPMGPAPSGQHASRAGHWVGAIPKNVPDDRKLAAIEFLKWFIVAKNQVRYTEFGAVPIRSDVVESSLAEQREFRFLKALAENSRVARMPFPVTVGPQIASIVSLHLNEAIIGNKTSTQALNEAAQEIHTVVADAGYSTGRLPDLK